MAIVHELPAPRIGDVPGVGGGSVPGDRTALVDVAAEEPQRYDTQAPGGRDAGEPEAVQATDGGECTLAERLARLQAEVAALQRAELHAEPDAEVAAAVVALQCLTDQLTSAHLRVVDEADEREVHRREGAVTLASWLRERTRMDHGQAHRLVEAAARLRRLPALRAALEQGEITYGHVTAVTRAMVPRRRAAIAEAEEALLLVARRGLPRDVAMVVRRIKEQTDPDGSDAKPLDDAGPDERRRLVLTRTIDGLWDLRGSLDVLTGELLATLLESFRRHDPPGTPPEAMRSAGQQQHDALDALLRQVADAGTAPTRHGQAPHVLLMVDLLALLGLVEQATRPQPTLRFSGATTLALARRLLAEGVKATAVLTMGPWRVVGVGATQRRLPGWLRPMLQMLHRRCRGPDCDRPAVWGDAHHVEAWEDHHDTDLNRTVPLCRAHHQMVTSGTWQMEYDADSGICTWTGPGGWMTRTFPPAL